MSDLIANTTQHPYNSGFFFLSTASIAAFYIVNIALCSTWLYVIKFDYVHSSPEIKAQWRNNFTFQDWSCLSLVLLILLTAPVYALFQALLPPGDVDKTFVDMSIDSRFIYGNFVLRGIMVVFR
jgi:hypothetical protein